MSATEIENTGVPLPRISRIRTLPDFRLLVTWAEGSRTGGTDTVDLTPVIYIYRFYRALRNDKELFQTAHLIDDGNAIAWGDGMIDMSAELIEDIANEAMTPQDFAKFLEQNKLTQEAAAALLGYSRRQIGYYLSTGPIPRVVALACYGFEARQKSNGECLAKPAGGASRLFTAVPESTQQKHSAAGMITPAVPPESALAALQRERVEAMIRRIADGQSEKFDWQRSIVDLMKLLKLDSSLSARKQLAQELGYRGAFDGSAEMNIWLHQQVMKKLVEMESGGVMPDSLTHA